jgi:hypothetical protein
MMSGICVLTSLSSPRQKSDRVFAQRFSMPRVQLATTASTLHGVARLGARFAQQAVVASTAIDSDDEKGSPLDSPELWWKLGISAILILLGGVFAGCVRACSN